ncbi:phosphotransferase [Bacillus sp. JJ1122]|uniref:phosphotransferase enzyme family protein n=1 Tax=Bacillus sp. JJ1122 TaxID=3122951 RepID=UPI002FFFD173
MSQILLIAAREFGFENGKLITGGFQNQVYEYEVKGFKRILRISDTNRRSCKEIQSELNWLSFLIQNGISVCRPIKSKNGNLLIEGEGSIAVSFEKAPGNPANVSSQGEWNGSFFKEWGRYIGRIHSLSKQTEVQRLFRPRWREDHQDVLKLGMQIQDRIIKEKYLKLLGKLKSFTISNDNFGLIHNDFHQGNFFVHNGEITAFDFDDCAYYWFANDIAVAFYHAYWQGISFRPDIKEFGNYFIDHFFQGYSETNKLTAEIINQIPVFLKIREVFLYHLFVSSWNMSQLEDWQTETLKSIKESIMNETPYSDVLFSEKTI